MNIQEISRTKEGRHGLIKIMTNLLNDGKKNWQGVVTPEQIVREMVRSVPDVKALQKILVLFNIEFLECLIKEMGVDPSCVTLVSDSELEGTFAEKIYGVHGTVIVEHTLEGLKAATSGCVGYDVIFSNPPYQIQSDSQKGREGAGSIQAKPIYHEIVMYAIDSLKPHYLCMITPSRWMAGGMGLGAYRGRMLSDTHIKSIVDFPGSSDVFRGANIKGGVSYFLWDRDYSGLCTFNGALKDLNEFDVLVRDSTSCQILRKVISKTSAFCNRKVLPNKPFGLATNFSDWLPEGTPGAVKCYSKNKTENWTIKYEDTKKVLSMWKVCTSAGINPNSEGNFEVYNTLFIASTQEICNETYIVAGAFSTQKEAENYAGYMKTRFYRFMLSLRVISQHINTEKFAWVPDMPHYNKVWTDQDMYTHFGLTKKEIEHIEKSIKAIK